MNIKINEEFKKLIPPLEEDEYKQLESSIKKEGVREPLVLWGDVLVDGHNRKEIADKLKVKYQTSQKQFKDKTEVILWMIDNQLGRRNISKYDRTRLNLKKEDILRPIAERNMKSGKTLGRNQPRVHVREEVVKVFRNLTTLK